MFFPYQDDNPREHFPVVTLVLIAINIFIFLIFGFRPDYEDIVIKYGFTPDKFEFFSLFTSMFLHGGLLHLIFNMWFLWLFADNIEDKFGKVTFLAFYLLGGIAAALIHFIVSTEAMRSIPCIGASGAISAVMGGYFVLFPKARVRCFVFYFYHGMTVSLSAFLFLGIWFLKQFLYGGFMATSKEAAQIAYGTHIGGFIFGMAVAFILKEYAGKFLLLEDKITNESHEELERLVSETNQDEEREKHSLKEYNEIIEKYLEEKKIDEAIEKYIEFEHESIPGALNAQSQKLIAEIIEKQGRKLLTLQAYLRFIFNYKDDKEIPSVYCKLGLLYIRSFKDPTEGIRYLREGLAVPEAVGDAHLFQEAKRELERIENLLKQTFVKSKESVSGQEKFAVLAQLMDEDLFNEEKIFKTLQTIGAINERNIGIKLAYNSKENLRVKDGVMLQNLEIEEADLAANKLQSIGIPVVILKQEDLLKFPSIRYVVEASIDKDWLLFKTEEGESLKIKPCDVLYVSLGQIAYTSYKYRKDEMMHDIFDIEVGGKYKKPLRSYYNVNCLLDIFAINSYRYRISSINFNYIKSEDKNRELFAKFVKDLALVLGGEKIDERTKIFISNHNWIGLNFSNVDEFNEKSLWAVRLRNVYGHLLK